jgi:hypothetical protein
MSYDSLTKPTLTEPGVKYFLNETLKQCHHFKMKHNNLIFNICLGVGFALLLGGILLYKYKGKLSPSEKEVKNREKQQYILSKIKNFQDAKRMAQQTLITGLPEWENEYDILHNKFRV